MGTNQVKTYMRNGHVVRAYSRRGRGGRGIGAVAKSAGSKAGTGTKAFDHEYGGLKVQPGWNYNGDGTWTDASGKVVGYAESEDSPMTRKRPVTPKKSKASKKAEAENKANMRKRGKNDPFGKSARKFGTGLGKTSKAGGKK